MHDLLALRRAGAPRAELERLIATRLGEPIALRLAAMHWVNAVAPQPGAPSDAVQPVPPAFGQGGGARRMQAVEPR